MGIVRIAVLVCCLIGALAPAAQAQQTSARISGQGGLTIGEHSSWFAAAEGEAQVAPMFTVYGTFGRLADATPSFVQEGVDGGSLVAGVPLTVRSPLIFGIGGVKVHGTSTGVRPYAVAGVGVARVNYRIKAGDVDVSEEFGDAFGVEIADSGRVIEFGGGVQIPGPMAIDIGYRYMHLGADYNVSRLYAAVGIGF